MAAGDGKMIPNTAVGDGTVKIGDGSVGHETEGSVIEDIGSQGMGQTEVKMKREVGIWGAMAVIIGSMIGSGIFISPTGVAAGCNSVGGDLTLWVLCGFLATLGALCYVELAMMIPESGGEYPYLLRGFGPAVAFVFTWTAIIIIKPTAITSVALTCSGYLMGMLFEDGCVPPMILTKTLALCIIWSLMAINIYSVKWGANIQIFCTIFKLLALVFIIIGGFVMIGMGHTEYLDTGFTTTNTERTSLAAAFYSGLWAYDGWNLLNYMVEEVERPERNVPLAICFSIPFVTLIYLLTNISYFSVLSMDDLISSSAVAISWAQIVVPNAVWVIVLAVVISTFGCTNGTLLASSRIPYAAAKNRHMVRLMAYIHCDYFTPLPSLAFECIMSTLYLALDDLNSLIGLFGFASWIFYGLTFTVVVILRYTCKDAVRPFKVPLVVPLLMMLVAVFLVIAPLVGQPTMAYLYAILFILAGLIFYYPFIYFHCSLPGFDVITTYLQMATKTTPTSDILKLD